MLKKKWKSIFIISVACTVFNVAAHAMFAPVVKYDNPSFFTEHNIFGVTAALFLFVMYVLLAIVFVYFQRNLLGTKIRKGLRYGISFGCLWFFSVLGMCLVANSPLKAELLVGFFDFLTAIVLGLLLGKYIASNNETINLVENKRRSFLVIPTILIVYVLGRYIAYIYFGSELPYETKFWLSILWTMGIGFSMGVAYYLLQSGLRYYSSIKKSVIFGFVILGINWIIFNLFTIILVKVPLIELIILAVSDILLSVFGIFFFEFIYAKLNFATQNR